MLFSFPHATTKLARRTRWCFWFSWVGGKPLLHLVLGVDFRVNRGAPRGQEVPDLPAPGGLRCSQAELEPWPSGGRRATGFPLKNKGSLETQMGIAPPKMVGVLSCPFDCPGVT